MTLMKKTACLLIAAAMCAAAGCADKNKDDDISSQQNSPASAADSKSDTASDEESSQDDSAADSGEDSQSDGSEVEKEYVPGENLAKTAAMFDGSYTYTAKVTYSDSEGESEIIQASDGESFYQRNTESGVEGMAGDTAYLFTGSAAYDIDYNLNVYSECGEITELNIFKRIIDEKLEQTNTHIPNDAEEYTIEEYTYTGDTYMTVYDLYFDKDGAIAKYTATYTVEGSDDVIQTVEIVSVTDKADEKLFDAESLDELKDFGAMSEDERLGFCQGVCSAYGISTDNMYELNITTDDLKRIDFDSFRTLVYTYASEQ